MATADGERSLRVPKGRERVMTEIGFEFWLEEREKKMSKLCRQFGNTERKVMESIGKRDIRELDISVGMLRGMWREFEALCTDLLETEQVSEQKKGEVETERKLIMGSVLESLRQGEAYLESGMKAEPSVKPSKTRSSRRTSRSSSSLGLLKMKMVEAEIEMEDMKLQGELREKEEEQMKKRLEIEQEERMRKLKLEEEGRKLKGEYEAQRARKKFSILQKHVEDQELGSDDPDNENFDETIQHDHEPKREKFVERLNASAEEFVPVRVANDNVRKGDVRDVGYSGANAVGQGNVGSAGKIKSKSMENETNVSNEEGENSLYKLFLEQTAPSVKLEKFSGNAMDYRLFMSKFELEVEKKISDHSGRMVRLLEYTEGTEAYGIVEKHYWDEENGYHLAKKELQKEYEDEHKVSRAYSKRIRDWPNVKSNDGNALKAFHQFLVKARNSLKSEEYKVELNSQENLRNVIKKLSYDVQGRWNREVTKKYEWEKRKPSFDMMLKFLELESRISNNPSFSRSAMGSENDSDGRKPGGRTENWTGFGRGFGRGTGTGGQARPGFRGMATIGRAKKCHFCGMGNHVINSCFSFRKLPMKERIQLVRFEKKLCLGCLEPCAEVKHVVGSCTQRITCTICQKSNHPTCLHTDKDGRGSKDHNNNKTDQSNSDEKSAESGEQPTVGKSIAGATSCRSRDMNTAAMSCALVSIRSVETGKECGKVYCFIDSMANRSFISRDLVERLGVEIREAGDVDIATMGGKGSVLGVVTNLKICGLLSENRQELKAKKLFCVESMPMDTSDIMFRDEFEKWPHLKYLSQQIPEFDDSIPIGLLLGTDTHNATVPYDSEPNVGENTPYAVKYWLGWSGSGTRTDERGRSGAKNMYCHVGPASRKHVSIVTENESKTAASGDIENMFRKMYEEEFLDVKPSGKRSQEDERFMEIMDSETRFVPELGQYEMPLPFKGGVKPVMPDNGEVAKSEAFRLRSRLKKHPGEMKKVVEFMEGMVEKGYARKVPENQIEARPGMKWYLVYHPVKHPRKPEKTRIVFNGAKTHEDVCINQKLMVGPTKELGNDLLAVLVRWRQEPEAFVADIEDMFYRNRVEESDRSFLRYWWWTNPQLDGQPAEYQMNVHIFGATSSPACANYALKRLASDYKSDYSQETIETLENQFYVDDCLKSCPDVESARKCANELVELCGKGGYNLRKFAATNDGILQDLPMCAKQKVDLVKLADDVTSVSVERVLGMKWVISNDELQFEIELKDRPATKRGLLSSISSIYDRLGLVQPFLLKGRKILQRLTNSKELDWDDIIPSATIEEWQSWYSGLQNLENVRVTRCYKPKDFGLVEQCELHTYVDACEIGYGSCSYLKLVNKSGLVHVSFVMGKSRVVPEKLSETIARCELVASVLGAEVGSSLCQELTYENVKPFYWTDSKIVLAYLNNETRQFKTFVANRISKIKKLTDIVNWNHVSSGDNVADDASRGLDAGAIENISQHRWFTGPPGLKEKIGPEKVEMELSDLDQDDELKVQKETKLKIRSCATILIDYSKVDPCLKLVVRLSNWWDMKRRIALMIKLLNQKTSKAKNTILEVEDLSQAEDRILKSVQNEQFAEEIKVLKAKRSLAESNKLSKHSPFLDEKGLMRVGGRLEKWDTDFEVKHPVILPKESFVTEAIVRDCHDKVAHSGRNITINELRNYGYYIVEMISVVKRIIHKCVKCRRLRGAFGEQKMAQLPEERLQDAPAFSYCCVDMAGPFICRNGRKVEKRYLAVFSDLVFRGVHIEVCYSLEKDSMINAVRRFVSRRGNCRYMKSDNGTNFTGCVNELKRAMLEVEPDLRKYLLGLGCDLVWEWNTPYRSHAGGVWERQIGTMRRILESLLLTHPHQLCDEDLWTLICEVENIMNCRPIIVETVADPNSPTPLSPMTLLTQKTKVVLPPFGTFNRNDSYGKSWRRIQHFADEFWHRFKKEYFSQVQAYSKWTKERRNLKVGDVVLMKDESIHRNDWPLAIVEQVYTDDDNLVRSAKVRLSRKNWKETVKVYDRPITKLVLMVECDEN